MQRFYHTEWQEIPFHSFAELSYLKLADASFYEAFYTAFFKKYMSYDAIPKSWRVQKDAWVQKILTHVPISTETAAAPSILSVGCGIGYIEQAMLKVRPEIDLHVTEVTDVPLCWLRPMLSSDRCHVGFVPGCLPPLRKFDVILCATIDYTMTDRVLKRVLKALRGYLKEDGVCVIFSVTVSTEHPPTFRQRLSNIKHACKCFAKHVTGKEKKQFWGYLRTSEEYLALLQQAGFSQIESSPLDQNPGHLCFTGKK